MQPQSFMPPCSLPDDTPDPPANIHLVPLLLNPQKGLKTYKKRQKLAPIRRQLDTWWKSFVVQAANMANYYAYGIFHNHHIRV